MGNKYYDVFNLTTLTVRNPDNEHQEWQQENKVYTKSYLIEMRSLSHLRHLLHIKLSKWCFK